MYGEKWALTNTKHIKKNIEKKKKKKTLYITLVVIQLLILKVRLWNKLKYTSHTIYIPTLQQNCSPQVGVCMVRLREFFDPTHYGGSKKIQLNPTQPNPHGSGWVRLNPWIGQFFITIIIKFSKKNIYININISKKPKDQYQCNSLKTNNTND